MREFELADFRSEANNNEKVAIYFYADWSAESRLMSGNAERAFYRAEEYFRERSLAEPDKYRGGFSCGAMFIDDNKGLLMVLGVKAVPTVCLIDKAKVYERIEGYRSEKDLLKSLSDFIG